jgi:WD40 repeat protein
VLLVVRERHSVGYSIEEGIDVGVASGDYRTHMYDPKFGLPLPATVLVTPPQYIHVSTIHRPINIYAIAMSPDGRLIASGDIMGGVQIWDSRSHQPIGKAGKHRRL